MDRLPPELLRKVLSQAGNLPEQRRVCQLLNQISSVLLLEQSVQRFVARIANDQNLANARVQTMLDRNEHPDAVARVLGISTRLDELTKEANALLARVREKQTSLDAVLAMGPAALRDNQREALLRLCDLHPDFLCVSALTARHVALRAELGAAGVRNNNDLLIHDYPGGLRDRPRADPGRPRDPFGPPDFDPNAREPDPDHFMPPHFYGDEELPRYPGIYPGPPDVGGGLRDPRFGPQPPRGPPVNPDWDRDRFGPFDPRPPGGPGLPGFPGPGPRPPPGPFGPPGGGSFGGPRFL